VDAARGESWIDEKGVQVKPLVAILGCGPAGLLAAHACEERNVPFSIYSKKQKSILGGAQYSHIGIPGIHYPNEPDVMLGYIVVGDSETYQQKVYGDENVPFVSIDNVKDGLQVPAWNLGRMYDILWRQYESRIVDHVIDPRRAAILPTCFDLVFSSVPAPSLCLSSVNPHVSHWFKQQPVRIHNEALNPNLPDNTILYDGTKDHSYYRMSKIFGVGSTEWGASSPTPPLQDLRTINKPIDTNCDCHQADLGEEIPAIVRIGRFGTWKKGELTFHGYNRVVDTLEKLGIT
jgi:hypothetical protein